jgi:hypothetical protein
VIGSIVSLGIFAATRGVRVFAEDEIHQTLYPLDVATSSANGAQIGTPHKRKVFFTTAPLDSLPPNSYVLIKELATEFKWVMGGTVLCLEEMAEDARKLGADAVFNVYTRQRFAFGGSPIRPTATGMAVALRDPCATRGISGEYRPADEADTPQNRAVSARCEESDSVRSIGPGPKAASGKCSVEQVLTMKASGLSDDQVKAACGK